MIVDASALVAIVLDEAEAQRLSSAIGESPVRMIPVLNWLEALMVITSRYGEAGGDRLRQLAQQLGLKFLPLDDVQMEEAYRAWQRFGKGHHPARLNLGDCCAYAASIVTGEPLLYKGSDFARTDVTTAAW